MGKQGHRGEPKAERAPADLVSPRHSLCISPKVRQRGLQITPKNGWRGSTEGRQEDDKQRSKAKRSAGNQLRTTPRSQKTSTAEDGWVNWRIDVDFLSGLRVHDRSSIRLLDHVIVNGRDRAAVIGQEASKLRRASLIDVHQHIFIIEGYVLFDRAVEIVTGSLAAVERGISARRAREPT